jgi:hypothetical protein
MGQCLVFADESVAVTHVYSAGQAHVFIVRAISRKRFELTKERRGTQLDKQQVSAVIWHLDLSQRLSVSR